MNDDIATEHERLRAIVTGGGTGIGAAVARRLAAVADVLIIGRR